MKKTIIVAFVAIFFFNLFLSIMNYLGDNSPELMNELLKYFSQDDIVKGEMYSRGGFIASLLRSVIFAVFILIFSFTSLSRKLEMLSSNLAKNRDFITSLYYIAILYILLTVISLPFNFYFSYILEHRSGFSNITAGLWFWRRVKSFLLILPFISVIGSLALLAIKKFKFYSVLIVPAGGLLIGLAMLIIYPIIVLPLFYEIKTISNPSLEKRIVELAQKSEVAVDKIYIIKESDYSKHTNAFFVGFGTYKKIYLYDNLIQNNSESEIISILAHEIGHWKYNHNMKGVVIGFLLSLAVLSIMYRCLLKLKREVEFSSVELHSPSMIPLYLLLYIVFSNFTNPVEMAVSRRMEMNADYYALELTEDPDSFISSEIRIAKDNSSRLNKDSLSAYFRASHPMTIERIRMAEKYKELMIRKIK